MWGNILGNGGEPFMANAPIVHATPTRKHSAVATPLRTTCLNSWYATYSGEFADVCVEQPRGDRHHLLLTSAHHRRDRTDPHLDTTGRRPHLRAINEVAELAR